MRGDGAAGARRRAAAAAGGVVFVVAVFGGGGGGGGVSGLGNANEVEILLDVGCYLLVGFLLPEMDIVGGGEGIEECEVVGC